jgi:hypothetical protein
VAGTWGDLATWGDLTTWATWGDPEPTGDGTTWGDLGTWGEWATWPLTIGQSPLGKPQLRPSERIVGRLVAAPRAAGALVAASAGATALRLRVGSVAVVAPATATAPTLTAPVATPTVSYMAEVIAATPNAQGIDLTIRRSSGTVAGAIPWWYGPTEPTSRPYFWLRSTDLRLIFHDGT